MPSIYQDAVYNSMTNKLKLLGATEVEVIHDTYVLQFYYNSKWQFIANEDCLIVFDLKNWPGSCPVYTLSFDLCNPENDPEDVIDMAIKYITKNRKNKG